MITLTLSPDDIPLVTEALRALLRVKTEAYETTKHLGFKPRDFGVTHLENLLIEIEVQSA